MTLRRWPAAAVAACLAGPSLGATVSAPGGAFLPNVSAATFEPGTPIDNPYFPVDPRIVRTYEGVEEDDGELLTVRSVQRYAGPGRVLMGVQTVAVSDVETVDGVTVEETLDYFAQDVDGNVWYFGEDVTNYRYGGAGEFLGTDSASAWLAGIDGALPGYIMPAVPTLDVGLNFYQEFAPANDALDEGTVLDTDATVTIGLGTFSDVLVVLETTALEPDVRELNYYAPGIGQILTEEGVDENFSNAEAVIPLVEVAPVPLPAGLGFLAAGLGGLTFFRRAGPRRG